ncbi:uncharacterized protein LOC142814499 isoform X2 [Rhipicephalus microplus]|uniref:uncharacterized protein LOC142814499 isoform X2 n=1 Tax=Rhipicephalus microplus TaxID=6941 RepID=UPI003F6B2E8B
MRTFNVTGQPPVRRRSDKTLNVGWREEKSFSCTHPLHGPGIFRVAAPPEYNMRRSTLLVIYMVVLMTESLWTVLAEDIEREDQYGKRTYWLKQRTKRYVGFGEDQEEAGLLGKIKAIPKKIDFSKPYFGLF